MIQHDEEIYVFSFLMGLNDMYASIRLHILMMDPLPSISKVYGLITQEEGLRSVNAPTNSSLPHPDMAFLASSDKSSGNKGPMCKDRPFCTHCKIPGHTVDKCYKLHGYPPGYKPRPKVQPINQISSTTMTSGTTPSSHEANQPKKEYTTEELQGLFQQWISKLPTGMFNNSATSIATSVSAEDTSHFPGGIYCLSISCPPHELFNSTEWVVDSGVTCHICSKKNCFTSPIHPIPTSLIILPDGSHYTVSLGGEVQLGDCLMLRNVLFMPELHFNLMAASKTTDLDFDVHFSKTHAIIQELSSKRTIGKANRRGDLYYLDPSKDISPILLMPSYTLSLWVSPLIWHNRLGHLSDSVLDTLREKLSLHHSPNSPCHVCHLAKQRRLLFLSCGNISDKPFDLINCDIWGPYHIESHGCH